MSFGYLGIKHVTPTYSISDADYNKHSLESMEDESVLIVVGKPSGKNEQHIETLDDGNYILNYYTISEVEITKVIDGDASQGDFVNVFEPYGEIRRGTGLEVLITDIHMPMNKDQEYLLFLAMSESKAFPDGTYEPVSHYQGIHVIQDKINVKLDTNTLEINEPDEHYEELHQKVTEKYADLIISEKDSGLSN